MRAPSDPEVSVRLATAADLAPLAVLARDTFVAAYRDQVPEPVLLDFTRTEMSTSVLTAEWQQPGTILLVAVAGAQQLIGYAELHPTGDGGATIELTRIYLDPQHTGGGHGSRLLQVSIDEATRRGFTCLRLGVWEHNLGAQRFYRRWGFAVVGSDHFQLGPDRQTDLVMERPL
jgi:diamine N-acetyltransferase